MIGRILDVVQRRTGVDQGSRVEAARAAGPEAEPRGPGGPTRSEAEPRTSAWRQLPPIERTELNLERSVDRFARQLTVRQRPLVVAPLTHAVGPAGPPGLVGRSSTPGPTRVDPVDRRSTGSGAVPPIGGLRPLGPADRALARSMVGAGSPSGTDHTGRLDRSTGSPTVAVEDGGRPAVIETGPTPESAGPDQGPGAEAIDPPEVPTPAIEAGPTIEAGPAIDAASQLSATTAAIDVSSPGSPIDRSSSGPPSASPMDASSPVGPSASGPDSAPAPVAAPGAPAGPGPIVVRAADAGAGPRALLGSPSRRLINRVPVDRSAAADRPVPIRFDRPAPRPVTASDVPGGTPDPGQAPGLDRSARSSASMVGGGAVAARSGPRRPWRTADHRRRSDRRDPGGGRVGRSGADRPVEPPGGRSGAVGAGLRTPRR